MSLLALLVATTVTLFTAIVLAHAIRLRQYERVFIEHYEEADISIAWGPLWWTVLVAAGFLVRNPQLLPWGPVLAIDVLMGVDRIADLDEAGRRELARQQKQMRDLARRSVQGRE